MNQKEAMTDHIPENLLHEVKLRLRYVYEDRLHGVYLFSSYARGEVDPGSDLDVLIVLDDICSYSREMKRTGELVSSHSLKYNVSISRTYLRVVDW
jgi:uncharacterized protein